jgi:hypothetical protein
VVSSLPASRVVIDGEIVAFDGTSATRAVQGFVMTRLCEK